MRDVKNGFPTRLNSREVEVEQKMMGKETIKVKLSSRAVVEEQRLGDVCSMLARMCWRTIPCIESRPLFRTPKMAALSVIFLRYKCIIICAKVAHIVYQPILAEIYL